MVNRGAVLGGGGKQRGGIGGGEQRGGIGGGEQRGGIGGRR